MDTTVRDKVRRRAGGRCEYCKIPDAVLDNPFHVEHIIATVHQLDDRLSNLAWACARCNLHKGPNLTTIDPESGLVVKLFNPRRMNWIDHFSIENGMIVGLTPAGRGTARLLDMNSDRRVEYRLGLMESRDFEIPDSG